MKLKMVVVDLELTLRQKRLGASGLAVAAMLAAGAAWADVPNTFVAGETLKAADLNEKFATLEGDLFNANAALENVEADVAALDADLVATNDALTGSIAQVDARVTVLESATAPLTTVVELYVPNGATHKADV